MMLFEENHEWKDIIWFVGSSTSYPSNLGMSKGSSVDIVVQLGSLISLLRSSKFRPAMYGNQTGGGGWGCCAILSLGGNC